MRKPVICSNRHKCSSSISMNYKQSSPEMATKAARVLLKVKASKTEKSLAGSVLAQASPTKIILIVKK